jgi:hypothetical protein
MLLALAVVSLLPLASAKVTGDWRESPYTLYAKNYLPFDQLGFGLDSLPPERALPADMKGMIKLFAPMHADHTVRHLPRIFFDRWEEMFADAFRGDRLPLVFFAIVSLAVLPAAGWFAVAGSLLLTVCYLSYAHPAAWDAYYLEILPLLPFMTACGIWAFWVALRRRSADIRLTSLRTITPSAALASLILAAALLLPGRSAVIQAERLKVLRGAYKLNFATAVAHLPGEHTIVFIRYAPWHRIHTSLIANDADLADARTWFVYDRGAENAKLMALAPGRVPYLYDERSGAIERLVVPRLAGSHAGRSGVRTTDHTGS